MQGHEVWLYEIVEERVDNLAKTKQIYLQGSIEVVGKLASVSNDIYATVKCADIIMLVTTANAHSSVAQDLVADLVDG